MPSNYQKQFIKCNKLKIIPGQLANKRHIWVQNNDAYRHLWSSYYAQQRCNKHGLYYLKFFHSLLPLDKSVPPEHPLTSPSHIIIYTF